MGWPEKQTVIASLGTAGNLVDKVQNVELLGFKDKVQWVQEATGLRVQMPAEKPCNYSIGFKIDFD